MIKMSKSWKKSYSKKINTKEGSQCIYIQVIASVNMKDKNYYCQVLLEKYKHVVRAKKMSNFITDNIEIYSDDSDDFDEKTEIKKIYEFVFRRNKNNMINLFFKKNKENIRNFFKLEILNFLSEMWEVYNLVARKFHFLKYKKRFQSGFFSFVELGKLLPEK